MEIKVNNWKCLFDFENSFKLNFNPAAFNHYKKNRGL